MPRAWHRSTTPGTARGRTLLCVRGVRPVEWGLADWGPVLVVSAVAQAAIGLEQPWAGSDLELTLTTLLLALPLLWRRRAPLWVCAALALALPVQMALGGTLHFGTFVAMLVGAWSAGRHASSGRLTATSVGVLLLGIVVAMHESIRATPGELVFPVTYLTAAALAGRVVLRQARQAEELRGLNDSLRRERETSARLAVATERLRMARDLHDGLAHTIMTIVIQAEAAEGRVEADPAAVRRALARIQESGRHGLTELRGMVRLLREDAVVAPPTLDDVDQLATALGDDGLRVVVERDADVPALSGLAGEDLFRVVQESLTNVLKHSAATSALVGIRRDGDAVAVSVSDPGPRRAAAAGDGHGLVGMAERLAPHGGTVTAGPAGDGFAVVARVPIGATEERVAT